MTHHALAMVIILAGTGFFTAQERNYLDLNITECDKTEILPGELSCIPRLLHDVYEDDISGDSIAYCEVIFY